MITLYGFNYRYKQNPSCYFHALDRAVLQKKHKEVSAVPDNTVFDIWEHKCHSLTYQDDSPFCPFGTFLTEGAVLAYERHVDFYRTGTRRFYTTPEHYKEVVKAYESSKSKQKPDRYPIWL